MIWPENLKPTTSEILLLADHREIAVPKAAPCFSPWLGPSPGDTFGGKTLLDFKGRPAFAELIILWSFLEAGWEGVWVDSFQKRYLRGFWPVPLSGTLPRERDDLLRQIAARTEEARPWDVFCWSAEAVVFAEAKRQKHDSIRLSQKAFLASALDLGLAPSSFLLVEWSAA